ncbi:hypothetical protein C0993_007473, partial [Termitomyces sp. T159_Od127]
MDSKPTEQTKGKVVDNVGEKYNVEDQESASDGVHGGLVRLFVESPIRFPAMSIFNGSSVVFRGLTPSKGVFLLVRLPALVVQEIKQVLSVKDNGLHWY